jgi:hypothetical protein
MRDAFAKRQNNRGLLRCARCLPKNGTGRRGVLAIVNELRPRRFVARVLGGVQCHVQIERDLF